jgi:hypothetical protein
MSSADRLIAGLESRYKALQSEFVVECGPEGLDRAVTSYENHMAPVHRWYEFKEAFGASIFDLLSIDETRLSERDSIFVDPFCGSGTTILSSGLRRGWACHRIGVETNPFIAFVANTKVRWRDFDPTIVETLVRDILANPLRRNIPEKQWPALSTLRDVDMFESSRVSFLIDAIGRCRRLPNPYNDLFLLGVASIIEKLSLYRKTGRALRKIHGADTLATRENIIPERELRQKWKSFASDIRKVARSCKHEQGEYEIVRADGRSLDNLGSELVRPGSVSLMVYSPPYLNQIDYTEVYKVESWLLGFIDSNNTMKNQRLATVRSHSSVKFEESRPELTRNANAALELVTGIVSGAGDQWHKLFPSTAYGYFFDMQRSLQKQFELLEPGGQVRCIIGNSAYGSKGQRIAVATDLFLADIANAIGFEVPRIQIARMLPRKDHLNQYLRESVIWMRKPLI